MKNQYHVLNGDALKSQFPISLEGEIIITRECLIEGNIAGENLDDFFRNRANYINENFPYHLKEDYYEKVVSEFEKILNIANESEVNLWFEDDLFCQINCWFVLYLLTESKKSLKIYLVRPQKLSRYGFGGLSKDELIDLYSNRILLKKKAVLNQLWPLYQKNEINKLIEQATLLKEDYPFILKAVNAHIMRIPKEGYLGRPIETLKEIIRDFETADFTIIFNEFKKREPIYGFGDKQMQQLLKEIL